MQVDQLRSEAREREQEVDALRREKEKLIKDQQTKVTWCGKRFVVWKVLVS